MIALATLLLAFQLAEPTEVRLATSGTGDEPAEWWHDGQLVATTVDGQAATVALGAGRHELWVHADTRHAWVAMARPDAPSVGVGFQPAWTARAPAVADGSASVWPWVAGLTAGAVLLGVERTRRRTDPALPPR